MSGVTHLTKRYDGIYYLQVRLTRFTNKSWLLRLSLSTRLHREARLRLCAYQSWLLLMQTPAEINENIAHIIQQVHKFVDERGQRSAFDVNHRKHFHSVLSRMLDDWRVARPNPITYRSFWARLDELAHLTAALGQIVKDDEAAVPSTYYRDDYLLPPDDPYGYFTENGRVTHVVPCVLERRNADYFYRPDDMKKPPRFAVGDIIADVMRNSIQGPAAITGSIPQPVQRPVATAGAAPDNARVEPPETIAPVTSELLAKCLIELEEESGSSTAVNDVRPYVEFLIHILGDRPIASYDRDDFRQLSLAFSAVPLPSAKAGRSLIERYVYAQTHGWDGLKRLSETTLENRCFCGIKRFFSWARDASQLSGEMPKLKIFGNKNTTALDRDSFSDAEITSLFSLPKFAGHLATITTKPGPFLRQDGIYWSYVILFFTGMRPGEIAQLEIGDIQEHEGVFWFDLRPFDPAKGRIAREDIKQFKTPAASRMIPIHPTLLELGLIERAAKLQRLGHTRLFPELRPTVKGGVKKWGHAMARDWQKRKHLVTTRCNVTAYSGRHGMAELLRELHIDPHDIEKFLGHAHPGVTGRYGRKGLMPATVVAAFINAEPPIISWVRTHLVDARDRSEAVGCLIESWAKKPAEDYR